ncbi:uncharacterized protein MONOS_16129 [Monocercomonoides exilis]|uniref:uncharacterized protein n=1 Tax=Monocercomonoides exilis TaxID=2049356 RepID=UPI00355A6B63|nr:hypothetical protein MONOS_16129 [Monocercomonoides exilis]|eukprot:MONOS_16129.1-p1 / transcript=MONOS_16129.1 / gene=MONOS_16129 / organism=Monocercomonoides_exilis_PA203 / gene_product=unspecified product / transcript_product=unspecified product / location=Mono_scaffold01519:861-2099(-) / protein_length=365 / sequence_SO=supercontig / SO=protein_coding / is_pseudo=false
MNEESGREGGSIDLEKEEGEEEEEGQILDVESLLSVPAHPECVTLVDESACGSWRDYLVTMTVTGALVELCAERERIVWKPVVEGMIQPDMTMSITFIVERLFGRRKKSREGGMGGGGCMAWDWALLHLNSDRQRETMDELVAIGAVVLQESAPLIALRDATYAIGQVYQGKWMIGVFGVSYCVFVDEWESLRMCAVDFSVDPLAAPSAFRWMLYLLQGGIEIGSSSGVHRSASQRQVVGVQRVPPQPASDWNGVSAHACADISPSSIHIFVKEQPFYYPELKRVPHGQWEVRCAVPAGRTSHRWDCGANSCTSAGDGGSEDAALSVCFCAELGREEKDGKAGVWRERGCGKRDGAREAGWNWG